MTRVNLGLDTSGRPLVVDSTTLAKLRAAELRLKHKFTIVQGSWRGDNGAEASADTHKRGGVIDLRSWDLPAGTGPQEAVTMLRRCGLIAWYRTQAQGFDPHIHCIDYGNPDLDPSAARQVAAWEQGRNGLASNGPDDGARVTVPKSAPEPPKPPENSVTRGRAHLRGAVDLMVAANNDFRQAEGRTAVRAVLVAGTSAAAAILRTALKRGPKR